MFHHELDEILRNPVNPLKPLIMHVEITDVLYIHSNSGKFDSVLNMDYPYFSILDAHDSLKVASRYASRNLVKPTLQATSTK